MTGKRKDGLSFSYAAENVVLACGKMKKRQLEVGMPTSVPPSGRPLKLISSVPAAYEKPFCADRQRHTEPEIPTDEGLHTRDEVGGVSFEKFRFRRL